MEIKITAKLKGEEIRVKAEYLREEEKVHEINTAFPIGTSEKKIRKEIQKAGELFELEEKQRAEQQEVDKKFEQANKIVNNLNS